MPLVYVVDDDPGTLETFECGLRLAGQEVRTAASGAQAFEVLQQQLPDVLLIDLKLGDISALEIIRALHSRGISVPVVVMTGFGTISSAVEAMKLGAVDFLEKPLEIEDVVEAVERTLAHSKMAHSRSVIHADGLGRWALAVVSELESLHDPKTLQAWSAIRGVAPETLRGWCKAANLHPKPSLDLARALRAVYQARVHRSTPGRFLDVADYRTLERLLTKAGLESHPGAPTIGEVLRSQTFIKDETALDEISRVLLEFALDAES